MNCPFDLIPYTYYSGNTICYTEDCVRYNVIAFVPSFYSNNNNPYAVCGKCGQFETFLSADILVPQPITS